MLERSLGLPAPTLAAIAALEAATIESDGGRLKLEWGVLRERPADAVHDLLWWEGDALVGFAGLYAFGAPTVEVAGMVHPNHRRRGIGAALLDEMLGLCRERRHQQVLLVTPRTSTAAPALAASRGGRLEHSEHVMALTGPPADGPEDSTVRFRPATRADADEVGRLLTEAFGHPWTPVDLEARGEPTMVAERDGSVVATLRVHREPTEWGVYGFAVRTSLQGRGIGSDLLRRVCRQAGDAGIGRVHLEVSVDNDGALHLYTALGFELEATEDYYDVPV